MSCSTENLDLVQVSCKTWAGLTVEFKVSELNPDALLKTACPFRVTGDVRCTFHVVHKSKTLM